MVDLTPMLTVIVAGSTVISLRGVRGAIPAPIAFFGVSAAGIAALTSTQLPLLGWRLDGTLVGAAASFGITIVYAVVIALRGPALATSLASRPVRSLAAIAVLALSLVGMAMVVGRGRPQPSLDGCVRGPLDGWPQPELDLQQDGYRVAGVNIGIDQQTQGRNTCTLTVIRPSGTEERAALAPPWGLSGSYRCGTGVAVLCARPGILLVEEDPVAPLTMTEIHGFRLSPSVTPIEPTLAASASVFAPPREYVLLAAFAALLATIFAAAPGRRRAVGAEEPPVHPYRIPDRPAELVAPSPQPLGFLFMMPVPTAGVIALVLLTPLAIALCVR